MIVILLPLVLLEISCLVMPQPTIKELWDLTAQHQTVGRILQSVNLVRSRRWLATTLGSRTFPFQYIYDKQCHRLLTKDRLVEIMAHVEPAYHDRIASPTCLQNSKITLNTPDLIMLGVSPLKAPSKLPNMTDGAYRNALSEAIVFGAMPQSSCDWLLNQATHRLNFKIPQFWYFIHPECFKETPRRDDGKLGLLLHIFVRSNPLFDCITTKDFSEFLRWSIRICLIGLELNR